MVSKKFLEMYFKSAIALLWIAIISTGPGEAKGGKNTDTIPANWQERWETKTIPPEKHTDNLKRLQSTTQDVVIYHEGWMKSIFILPYLNPLSTAWKYTKETYGSFGDDPHLYVLLHGKKSNNCYTSSYFKSKGDNDTDNINSQQGQGPGPRNIIDCGQSLSYREGAWFPLSPQNLVKILENFPKLIRRGVKGILANPDTALGPPESEFQFNDIILYDILRNLTWSDPNFLETWKNKILEKNSDHPRPLPRTFWLKNWFLPIYEDHGGAEVINQYFTYMALYWPRNRNGSDSEYSSKMNFGEFVHFWSGAAGEDLSETARKTFGWNSTYETELVQARLAYPNFPYPLETKNKSKSITSTNKIMQFPSRTWHKNWKGQSQDLLLAYQDPDNHVAFYFQKFQLYPKTSFSVISKAWGYAQRTYGPFDPDPSIPATLYIVLHNGTKTKTGRSSKKSKVNKCMSSNKASHKDHEFNNRHVIDCEIANRNSDSEPKPTGALDDIMLQIGQLVLKLSKGTGNWPAYKVSKWSMSSILVYDIYLALSVERPHDAQAWKEKQMKHREYFPIKNTFWFRDWYLQIYDKHGGSRALNEFFSLLRREVGIRGGDYTTQLNMGEFVHFWSEAAGVDLYPYLLKKCQGCITSFVWTEEDQSELNKAAKEFPTFEYLYGGNGSHHPHPTTNLNLPLKEWEAYWNYDHQERVTLAYHDDHVAFYVDKENTNETEAEDIQEDHSSPLFGFNFSETSLVWQTFKTRYSENPEKDTSSSNGSILYIILHQNHYDNETGTHANNNSTDCAVSNNVSYTDKDFDNRHVIDCELIRNSNDNHTESLIQARLMHSMALMLLRTHKGTGNWPGRQFSKWSMTSILIYDMYISLGKHDNALQWREEQMKDGAVNHSHWKTSTIPHWFRDWYLKIYENHGNNQAHSGPIALSNFFSLLQENWLTKHQNYVGQLNMGEFIHFWSGAAGVSLIKMAENAFGLIDIFKMEVLEARVNYSKIVYTLEKSNETFPSTIILTETDNNILDQKHPLKHPQLLNIVIKLGHVGIYTESRPTQRMNSTHIFEMILNSLTHSWSYIAQSYPKLQLSLGSKLDPNLYTIFHHMKSSAGGHKMCGTMASLKISTELGHQEVRNTIHCALPVASHAMRGYQYLTSFRKYDNFIPEFREILRAQVFYSGGDGDVVEVESDEVHRDRDRVAEDRNAVPTVLDLVTFDLYFHSGDLKHAYAFFKRTNRKEIHQSKVVVGHDNPKLWLDWYLPIYTTYGGVSVLDKFLLLSHNLTHNKSAGPNSLKDPVLNFGELIHMWSGAAGESLLDLADRAFGWDQNLQNQYKEARKAFPNIEYSCSNCHEFPRKQVPKKVPVKEKHTAWGIFLVSIFAVLTIISLTFGAKSVRKRNCVRKLSPVQLRDLTTDEVNDFRLGNLNGDSHLDQVHTTADLNSLPFNSQFEIPKERLYIDYSRVLGAGTFGLVVYGRLKYLPQQEGDGDIGSIKEVPVAVKMTRPNVDIDIFKALIRTIKIVTFVGPHENIVSLLGTVTSKISHREAFLALEYCEKGDLLKHLKRNRQRFTDLWTNRIGIGLGFVSSSCFFNNEQNPSVNINLNSPATQENVPASASRIPMSTLHLLQWSRQIANGMDFLSSKNVIHGDLAARNILLNAESIAKISDFGLSRQPVNTSNYSNTPTAALPWRWMAIESLKQRNFSVQSDVWSFGVTLWEIFTLGKLPFPGRNFDGDFENSVTEGLRLSSPEFGSQQMYYIMMNCWKQVPSERASFAEIRADIDALISSIPVPESSPSGTGVRNWIQFE